MLTKNGTKRITLAEVANRAGVSLSTASFVLNGKGTTLRISELTRDRVIAAAAELDYTPNLLVKGMQSGRTNVLSFFNAFRSRTLGDLYMDRLMASLEIAARDRGFDMLVHCAFHKSAQETYRFLNGGRADGVIVFAPFEDDPLLPYLRTSRMPVVLINSNDPQGVLGSVREDTAGGMRAVAQALVGNGHTRILPLVEVGPQVHDAEERVRCLKDSLAELGISLLSPEVVEPNSRAIEAKLPEILERTGATVVFCWRDYLAYQLLEAAEKLGIEVPREISVVGFDGIHWPSSTAHQAASVRIDLSQLAATTVATLDDLVQNSGGPRTQKVIEAKLVTGSTLGPAPKH